MNNRRINKSFWVAAISVFMIVLILAPLSQGQFDSAALQAEITALQTQTTTLEAENAAEMSAISQQTVQQNSVQMPAIVQTVTTASQINKFAQTVMYDVNKIQQYQRLASTLLSQMSTVQSIFTKPFNSATLPQSMALENQVISGDVNQINAATGGTSGGSLQKNYQAVYGAMPTSTHVPAGMLPVLDMSDAQAQGALKKAIALDALAAQEEQVAQQLMNQLTGTAPGTAAMVNAQAAAWNLQAAAQSQGALAQLLRVESAGTSLEGFKTKVTAANLQSVLNK